MVPCVSALQEVGSDRLAEYITTEISVDYDDDELEDWDAGGRYGRRR
jgi:hypothetical protein